MELQLLTNSNCRATATSIAEHVSEMRVVHVYELNLGKPETRKVLAKVH